LTVRKRPGPGRPRSVASEEAIITATSRLLRERGFSGLTLSRVAARARASKSTIYRRWPTKEHLIVAAFNRWPVLIPHDSGDVLEDLMDLHAQSMRNLRRGELKGVMPKLVAARAEAPALAEVLDPLIERRYDPVRVILRRAIERGQLPRTTDVELGVQMIMDITASRLYFTASDASVPAIRDVFRVVSRGSSPRLLTKWAIVRSGGPHHRRFIAVRQHRRPRAPRRHAGRQPHPQQRVVVPVAAGSRGREPEVAPFKCGRPRAARDRQVTS
jgi:AcrR family transcriptional regulator